MPEINGMTIAKQLKRLDNNLIIVFTTSYRMVLFQQPRVLNVNYGHNAKLMKKCIWLMHYSQFIGRINQNIKDNMPVDIAIDEAINYCIKNGILKDILIKNRSEVKHMLLTEFDEKKFAKTMWNEGHQSGFSEGNDAIFTIMDEINSGNDTFEKLTSKGYDPVLVKKVLDKK